MKCCNGKVGKSVENVGRRYFVYKRNVFGVKNKEKNGFLIII